ILSGEFAASDEGGSLAELGMRTRIGNLGIQFSRSQLDGFVSELYESSSDPIRSRDLLRLDGSLPGLSRLSLALEARRDRLQSGRRHRDTSLRLSTTLRSTALSHTLRWLDADRASQTLGLLQFSRRVADIGITGQVNYRIKPQGEMTDVLLNADKPLRQGYRASLAVERLHEERDLRYTLGLTKVLGRFGLRLNASHSRNGES